MINQHIRLEFENDSPSDAVIAQRGGFEEVHCQQQAMESLGGIHRKLLQLFPAVRLF